MPLEEKEEQENSEIEAPIDRSWWWPRLVAGLQLLHLFVFLACVAKNWGWLLYEDILGCLNKRTNISTLEIYQKFCNFHHFSEQKEDWKEDYLYLDSWRLKKLFRNSILLSYSLPLFIKLSRLVLFGCFS